VAEPVERSAQAPPVAPSQSIPHEEEGAPVGSSDLMVVDEMRRTADARVRSPMREATRRFVANWAAVLSLVIIVALVLAAIFAPYLHTSNPTFPDFLALGQGPSSAHWFGTDPEGRDIYSRVLYGLRVPFIVSIVGTILTVLVGMGLGLYAGYFGGIVDSLLSRFTDLMFAFPAFLLTVVIVTIYGPVFDQDFPNGTGRAIILTAVFALVSWPFLMRFVRSLALRMKEEQFIEAARTVGTSGPKIILRHMVPNVWGLVLVQAALNIATIIATESLLSIFGLGVNDPTPDLGNQIYDGYTYMDSNPFGLVFPCLFLIIIVLAFTYLGDGIRDAVDPRTRR